MSEQFETTWLALREPLDHRARSRRLARRFLENVPDEGLIADLGAGTGSNARYLDGVAEGPRRWRLYDANRTLLERVHGLAKNTERVAGNIRDVNALRLDQVAGVTASALLDLVSAEWLSQFAELCVTQKLPVLLALSVNGVIDFKPAEPEDDEIRELFALDQKRDKGLGPALGASAPLFAHALFETVGANIQVTASPWQLGLEEAPVARQFLQDMARAAAAHADQAKKDAIAGWRDRRNAQLESGDLSIIVGHEDLLILPPD